MTPKPDDVVGEVGAKWVGLSVKCPETDDMPHVADPVRVCYSDLSPAFRARVEALVEALWEIQRGEGAFNMDPLTHAGNCIENMKRIATSALAEPEATEGE